MLTYSYHSIVLRLDMLFGNHHRVLTPLSQAVAEREVDVVFHIFIGTPAHGIVIKGGQAVAVLWQGGKPR